MNLEKKGGWDKDWVVLCFFFFFINFISLYRYLHIAICICMYMSIFEYSYFDYIVIHVYIEKEKVYTKREIGKFQNFIELLAALPQILKCCQS